jgi:hypothetical protein
LTIIYLEAIYLTQPASPTSSESGFSGFQDEQDEGVWVAVDRKVVNLAWTSVTEPTDQDDSSI